MGSHNPGYPNVIAARSVDDDMPTDLAMDPTSFALYTGMWVWNSSTLAWDKMSQPKSSDNAEIYGYNGTNWHEARIDAITRTLSVIDTTHHEIHEGDHYFMQGFTTLDDSPGVLRVKIVTPDTATWAHFEWKITSSGILATTLDEDATGSMAGGSAVTPLNSNRNSTNTSAMAITSGVTAADSYTTRIENDKWGAAGFKNDIGGGASREDEIILKQNTTYLRTFTSYTADNIVQFKASWYEHASQAV